MSYDYNRRTAAKKTAVFDLRTPLTPNLVETYARTKGIKVVSDSCRFIRGEYGRGEAEMPFTLQTEGAGSRQGQPITGRVVVRTRMMLDLVDVMGWIEFND